MLAFKKRDFNFVKRGMVKERLVDAGCGYDLVSKRETCLSKRFVSKANVPITFSYRERTNKDRERCQHPCAGVG